MYKSQIITTIINPSIPMQLVMTTGPVTKKEKVEELILKILMKCNLDINHEFIYCTSPKEAQHLINQKEGTEDVIYTSHAWSHGNLEAFDISAWFTVNQEQPMLETLFELAHHCGFWYLGKDYIVVCDRPQKIEMGDFIYPEDEKYPKFSSMHIEYTDGWIANDLKVEGTSKQRKILQPQWCEKILLEVNKERTLRDTNWTSPQNRIYGSIYKLIGWCLAK